MQAYLSASRLSTTQMPFPFTQTLWIILGVWSATLPLALVRSFGWITPLAVALAAGAFLAIESIAAELEEPFGDDPNDLDLDGLEEVFHKTARIAVAQVEVIERDLLARIPQEDSKENASPDHPPVLSPKIPTLGEGSSEQDWEYKSEYSTSNEL